jgi:hypothetical protein
MTKSSGEERPITHAINQATERGIRMKNSLHVLKEIPTKDGAIIRRIEGMSLCVKTAFKFKSGRTTTRPVTVAHCERTNPRQSDRSGWA